VAVIVCDRANPTWTGAHGVTSIPQRSFTIAVLTAVASVCLAGCRVARLCPPVQCDSCCRQNCLHLNSPPAAHPNMAHGPGVADLAVQTGETAAGRTWAEHVFPESFRLALRSPGGKFYALPTRPILQVPRPTSTGPTDSSRTPVEPEPIPAPPPLPQSSAPMLAPQPPVANDWDGFSPPSPPTADPGAAMPLRQQETPLARVGGSLTGGRLPESWLFALPADQRVAVRTQSQQVVLPDTPVQNPALLRRLLVR